MQTQIGLEDSKGFIHRLNQQKLLHRAWTKCIVKMKHLSRNSCSKKTLFQSKNQWTRFRITCQINQLEHKKVLQRKRKKYRASLTIRAWLEATILQISNSIIKAKAWMNKTTLSNKWGSFRRWCLWKEAEIPRLILSSLEGTTFRV